MRPANKKRKWLLLAIILLGLIACYKLFYKSYSNKAITQSADVVLSIDVKRNTNTILAYFLTTPKEWNISSIFHFNKDTAFDWKNAIEIPDYIFIFHSKGQPASIYYSVLTIKNKTDLEKGLGLYDFKEEAKRNGQTEYYSYKLNIGLIKKDDQILIGNIQAKDKIFIKSVADEIFNKKEYISTATLDKIVLPPNHFSIYLKQNDFLQEDAVINGNFSNGRLAIEGSLEAQKQFSFIEDNFEIHSQSLFSLAFTQFPPAAYSLLTGSAKTTISSILNFNIDSFLLPQNKKYSLDILGIENKTDSAVSYTYDDDFNKVEKVVVNKIQEPSFNFTVFTKDAPGLFQYLANNKNIEKDSGCLFVSIPFVKTYATANKDSLSLASYNYKTSTAEHLKCIGCFNFNPGKIPSNLLNYLPENVSKLVTKIESVNCIAQKENESINITLTLNCLDKTKPFLLSFK